jgi:maleate isomerase
MSALRDYGRRGRFGLLTPQANPTVEPEFRRCAPAETELYVARLTSPSNDPRTRLVDYLEQLPTTLAQYDTLQLDAVAFACTGSSYLLGARREAEILAAAQAAYGVPIETAAGAILHALEALHARRIIVVSPYPDWLRDAGVAYWQEAGIDVVATATVPIGRADTRGIYELQGADAAAVLARLDPHDADAVLVSGTGMPSLEVLRTRRMQSPPAISSNLCLAWRLHGFVRGGPALPQDLLS